MEDEKVKGGNERYSEPGPEMKKMPEQFTSHRIQDKSTNILMGTNVGLPLGVWVFRGSIRGTYMKYRGSSTVTR